MSRYSRLDLSIAALAGAVAVVAIGLVVLVLADQGATPTVVTPTPAPSPARGVVMAGVLITDEDCSGCHVTREGAVGLREAPVLGHPLEGWRDCRACHTDGSLVSTAAGHTGIPSDQCLVCHAPRDGTTPPDARPHHVFPGQQCIACHGVEAPLPEDMTGRTTCWLCHHERTASGETPAPRPGAGLPPLPRPGSMRPPKALAPLPLPGWAVDVGEA